MSKNIDQLGKTLFLSEVYPPLHGGTANKFSARCSRYPQSKIVVITPAVEGSDEIDKLAGYRIYRERIKYYGPKGFDWLGMTWDFIRAARCFLAAEHFDTIECARPLPEGVAGYVLAKLFRKNLIVNVQGEDISIFQNYRVERWVMRRILSTATLAIANSAYTENLIRVFAGKNVKTGIVYPGIRDDVKTWAPSEEEITRCRDRLNGAPVILTLGRLQARKGQDNLIRALPKLVKSFPKLQCLIVGSMQGGTPGLKESLEKLVVELNVKEHVTFICDVEDQQLPVLYAACDLFVMPNRREASGDVEGFGQVFLEAGHLRKPVIGGKSGGVPDAVVNGETGLLVDGRNPDEVAQAIESILSDPTLAASMGAAGRKRAEQMSSDQMFERYVNLVQNATANGKACSLETDRTEFNQNQH